MLSMALFDHYMNKAVYHARGNQSTSLCVDIIVECRPMRQHKRKTQKLYRRIYVFSNNRQGEMLLIRYSR